MKNYFYVLMVVFFFIGYKLEVKAQGCALELKTLGSVGDCNPLFNLKFEDNFSNGTLNRAKWDFVYPYQANDGICLYREENQNFVNQSNNSVNSATGVLQLISKRETTPINGFDLTSGMIHSVDLFGYGKYEIRCKIPSGEGHWPAFWIFGIAGGSWQEVDFFEFNFEGSPAENDAILMNIHYNPNSQLDDGDKEACGLEYNDGTDYSAGFHTYTVTYLPTEVKWYVDGKLIGFRARWYTILGQPVPCNNLITPGNYLLNKAFPKGTPSNLIINSRVALNSATLPNKYEIDYVRYWEVVPGGGCGYTRHIQNPFAGFKDGDDIVAFSNAKVVNSADLVATSTIRLKPNFHAPAGSVFRAWIDPLVCQTSARPSNDGNDTSGENVIENEIVLQTKEKVLEKDKDVKLELYPNPNNGKFKVKLNHFSGMAHLEVMDLFGKTIYSQASDKSNYDFDLSDYPKGIYFVKVTVGTNVFNQKIIYQ